MISDSENLYPETISNGFLKAVSSDLEPNITNNAITKTSFFSNTLRYSVQKDYYPFVKLKLHYYKVYKNNSEPRKHNLNHFLKKSPQDITTPKKDPQRSVF